MVKSAGGALLAVVSGTGCCERGGAEGDSVREEWAEREVSKAWRQEMSACTYKKNGESDYATVLTVWKSPKASMIGLANCAVLCFLS